MSALAESASEAARRCNMRKPDTYMPVVIGDYLKDTMRLTTEQHGAFFLILLDYWTKGAPPDDDETLASIARLPLDRWQKARPVLAGFFRIEGGRWVNKRAEEELAAAKIKSQKAADSANKRWDGFSKSEPDANAHASASPEHMLETCSAPAPSPISKKNKNTDAGFEEWYAAYPIHVGRGKAIKAYRIALGKTDHATLVAAAKRYAASPARKHEYTKHPTTWLNSECWLDDMAPAAPPPAPSLATHNGKTEADWERILSKYRSGGFWGTWGNRPESDGPWDAPRALVLAWRKQHGIGQNGEAA